jgi:hypothetical protein
MFHVDMMDYGHVRDLGLGQDSGKSVKFGKINAISLFWSIEYRKCF